MFAVIETGSKQYTVEANTILDVEKLDVQPEGTVVFDRVLLVNDGKTTSIGMPYLAGATVTAFVLEQRKDDKVIVFKFKRKTGYQKKAGHRQQYTRVRVQSIEFASK